MSRPVLAIVPRFEPVPVTLQVTAMFAVNTSVPPAVTVTVDGLTVTAIEAGGEGPLLPPPQWAARRAARKPRPENSAWGDGLSR